MLGKMQILKILYFSMDVYMKFLSITFGGKRIYGLLIDFACQRYGWTMDYVLLGISYVNLNMLFVDAITTVYLNDEERKKLGRGDGRMANADDPKNRGLIRKMISE